MIFFMLWIVLVFASKNENAAESIAANAREDAMKNATENPIVVKIEEDECAKKRKSKFIGVSYNTLNDKWRASRWSKAEKKTIDSGLYKYEETAAHASDTLARNLMENGEHDHKLNFLDDNTEVYPEKRTTSSNYFGVCYNEKLGWTARRWSKTEKKIIFNGAYTDEKTAAHASDTLARQLMANSEQNHKLNFPNDHTEVHHEEKTSSKYFGISFNEKMKRWVVQRWSRRKKTRVDNGYYKDEETAAHASDTLARNLIANDEQDHKLNFPDENTEVYHEKKTKSSKYHGISYSVQTKRWKVQRWSKTQKIQLSNGWYRDEETAAHASDTLARELISNGEEGHNLNFPNDNLGVHLKHQTNKRKRPI